MLEEPAIIRLQSQLKPEDYIKATHLHMRIKPWWKCFGIAFFIVNLFFLVSSGFVLGSRSSLFFLCLYFLLVFIFYAFFRYVFMPWKARKIFVQQRTMQVPYNITIFPDRIESISECGTTKRRFSDYYQYKVSRDIVLLYESQVLFSILPRRSFSSEEDFQTFLSYLEGKLGRPKR